MYICIIYIYIYPGSAWTLEEPWDLFKRDVHAFVLGNELGSRFLSPGLGSRESQASSDTKLDLSDKQPQTGHPLEAKDT